MIRLAPPSSVTPYAEGPHPRVDFVIEFVGPRSIPADAAGFLLQADWRSAMGNPALWGSNAADATWSPLATARALDSLSMSWPLTGPQGSLSERSASELLQKASPVGESLQRRPMALPVPELIDEAVRYLGQIREELDIGFSIAVAWSGSVPEDEVGVRAEFAGLSLSPAGSFDWRAAGSPLPLLSVTPLDREAFSPGSQLGISGVSIGFSLPRCPAPVAALDGCLALADEFATELGGEVYDQDGTPLGAEARSRLKADLQAAIDLFDRVGLVPGSAAAVRAFS